jgi:hypothetical protein
VKLGLTNGSSFEGDAPAALRDLADLYDGWLREAVRVIATLDEVAPYRRSSAARRTPSFALGFYNR